MLGSGDEGSSEIVMSETALMTEEPDMSDFDFGDSSALRTQFSGANIPFYFSRGFDDLKEWGIVSIGHCWQSVRF